MRKWGEELQPSGYIALCVCVSEYVCEHNNIIERLYVNPKASVVVNLGEEAILTILLCSTQLSK